MRIKNSGDTFTFKNRFIKIEIISGVHDYPEYPSLVRLVKSNKNLSFDSVQPKQSAGSVKKNYYKKPEAEKIEVGSKDN